MKKLLLLLLLTNLSFSQTLLQEDFNALGSPITLPTGWSVSNQSSPIGTGSWFTGNTEVITAYNGPANGYIAVNFQSGSGASTLSNWLMTPVVTVQNGDEVSFYTRIPANAYPDRMELRMSTLGASSTDPVGATAVGSYTTLCTSVNPNLTTTGYPATWTKITYVVSGLTGQVATRFALRYFVTDGGPSGNNSNYVGVDAFKIKRPVANDVSLDNVTVPAIITAGNFTFNGTITNRGNNAVSAYTVTWQSNGGVLNSYDVTGLNIAPGATNNFSHSVPLVATVGETYALNFNVSSVNATTDSNIVDNSLTRSTQVASGSTTYKPLIEKFTGSTCGPCASYNASTFNGFYAAQNQNFNYIAYQMNFPGAGDPYYTLEGGARRNYYGINAITSLRISGADYSIQNNQAAITNHINNEGAKPAYFVLTADRNLTSSTALVNYNITPYLTGNYVLYAAVIEKTTFNNVGTNGETSFKHVMMKMLPNASGTALALTAGTAVSGQITASLTGTNVEELADLEVIVFLQNPTTKEVVQSFKATDALSTADNVFSTGIKLYPNPANNFIKLSNVEVADVVVTDVTGKTVLNLKNVTTETEIKVSELNSGIYFVTVNANDSSQTIKFVKK